jgi:hypothetical protein
LIHQNSTPGYLRKLQKQATTKAITKKKSKIEIDDDDGFVSEEKSQSLSPPKHKQK